MNSGSRNARVDLLRGISIILVLLHHFALAYSLRDTAVSRVFGWTAVHAVTRNGNYGVTMFFVISGYLITSNAARRWGDFTHVGFRDFYVFRAARILPCLVLLLAIVNGVAAAGVTIFRNHPESGGPVSFWIVDAAALGFWMNVLMARAGWLNYVLCVLWSLSVEEVFYAGFPVLCRLLRRERWLVTAWLVFIVAGPVWRAAHQDDEAEFLYAYLACFDAIAIGCCAAVLARRVALAGRVAAGKVAAWRVAAGRVAAPLQVLAAACMGVLYLGWSIGETNVFGVTLMALGAAFLIVAAPAAPVRRPGLVPTAVRWCGRLSYELYLFHLLVLAGLRVIWPPETTPGNAALVLLCGYGAGSAALGWLVQRFYSEPARRLVRQTFTAGEI